MSAALPLIVPDWPAPPNVRAAMTTRRGGVSRGVYESLNLGSAAGDAPDCVAENRRRLRSALELPGGPAWLKQVHGVAVVRISPAVLPLPPTADASFTTDAGVVCAVLAADCLPVLFCDDTGTAVAAAHAGWRGLAAGVLEATVAALPAAPGQLMAWLGAAIGPGAFEVGPEVRAAFLAQNPAATAGFRGGAPGKFFADLYVLARQRLARAGVTRVYGGERCTHRESADFFSHRRDGICGRQAALIWRVPAV